MEKRQERNGRRAVMPERKRKLTRAAALLAVAFALAWIMELLQLLSMPKTYDMILPEDVSAEAYPWEQRYEWVHIAADPNGTENTYLDFKTEDITGLQSVFLQFAQPTQQDTMIRIYDPAAEGHAVSAICPAGTTMFYIPVPAGDYETLRIGMDYDGSMPFRRVDFSSSEPIRNIRKEGPHIRRVLVMTLLWAAVLGFMAWQHTWERIRKTLKGAAEGLKAGKKTAVWYILLFPAMIGACVGLGALLMPGMAGKEMTGPAAVLFGMAGLNLAAAVTFRKTLRTQPEYHFLLLCMSIGILFCCYTPHTGLNSWDEEYHYDQALISSYVDEQRVTPQDKLPNSREWDAFDLSGGGLDAIHDRQDSLYQAGAGSANSAYVQIPSIPEAFNGAGLYLGRVLGLRYYQILVLGRMTGLLAYALAGFFAIRKLKSGKMIAAVVMLIPTSMFLTGTYNYDIYVTGFILLGLSYYAAQWQSREQKLTLSDTVIMVGALAFGCLAKMIYFPVILIPAFMPRDKFRSSREHWLFLGSLAAAVGAVILSYAIPTLIHTGGVVGGGDLRGGETVNAGEQIRFILNNPGRYLEILWKYMRDQWLNLRTVNMLLTNIAYYGLTTHEHLYLVLMMVAAFTDKNEYDDGLVHKPLAHAGALILTFGTLLMAATSMYIQFTPVGLDTINGAQYRYMIPLIFPFLMFIGSGKVKNRMDRAWYNGLVLGAAGFAGFAAVFNGFAGKYF